MEEEKEEWNQFKSDKEIAVVCPEPATIEQTYLRMLARKFGRPVPRDYTLGTQFLYGQMSHGSSNWQDHEHDREAKEKGEKYFIPEWITELSRAFRHHYAAEIEDSYKRGKAKGKSLLRRLASGDMSVLDFEDPRS